MNHWVPEHTHIFSVSLIYVGKHLEGASGDRLVQTYVQPALLPDGSSFAAKPPSSPPPPPLTVDSSRARGSYQEHHRVPGQTDGAGEQAMRAPLHVSR